MTSLINPMTFDGLPHPQDPTKKVTDMVNMIAPQFQSAAQQARENAGGAGAASARRAAAGPAATADQSPSTAPRQYELDELRKLPVRELKVLLRARHASAHHGALFSPQVRELKVLLRAHGVSEVEVVEKEELVQVIYALQQSAIKPEG
jgi:hypothetical protein